MRVQKKTQCGKELTVDKASEKAPGFYTYAYRCVEKAIKKKKGFRKKSEIQERQFTPKTETNILHRIPVTKSHGRRIYTAETNRFNSPTYPANLVNTSPQAY